jgi:flagellar motor switch protein FliM
LVASHLPSSRDLTAARSTSGVPGRGGDVHVLNGRHPGPTRLQPYDFRRPSLFSKDHLRTLQTIHEQFARGLAMSLSSFLRLTVRAQLMSVQQASFEDYATRIPDPTVVYVFRMSPLEGPVTLELGMATTRIMLDRLCGGPGTVPTTSQHLTEIERSLLRPLGRQFTRALSETWAPLIEIQAAIDDVLLNPSNVWAVTQNDIIALLTFELTVGEVVDGMLICLPYHSLEPVMDQLSARIWNLKPNEQDSNATEETLRARLEGVPVNATVILGEVDITTSSVVDLREGDVIRLSTAAQGDLSMTIDGLPLFRCRPGQSAGHVAVQIDRVVEPMSSDR